MRKGICLILILLMSCLLILPAMAASGEPKITMHPQSPNYPTYSVAIYTVKAEGTNLTATWYIEWQGKTYTASDLGGAMQAWEPYAGEGYGPRKLDNNTFAFIFEGIEQDLDGAYIWCIIEDGHYDVTSQKARISVGNPNSPPEILDIPAELTVEQGAEAEIRCVAKAPDGTQLSYLWYESDTGRIEDIRAVNRGTETADYLFCDTSYPGVRNYICFVSTSDGGFANSSFVTVTVTPKTQSIPEPQILTESLPEAVAGTPYSVQIQCSDPDAEFFPYYNPGGKNDLDKTGLGLSIDGWLMGTPTEAGAYSFCISVMGAGGEDYRVYTLNVVPAPTQETTAPTEAPTETTAPSSDDPTTESTPPASEGSETESAATETTSAPVSDAPSASEQDPAGISWWVLLLVGIASAGIGVGTAMILIKKKS